LGYLSPVDVFAALADPVRRELLAAVAVRPRRVVDLAAGRAISRPAVSKHLRLLSEAGLIEAAAHGRERHYTLRPEPLGQLREFVERLLPAAPRVTDRMLDALDTEVHRASKERGRENQATARYAPGSPAQPEEETA
jgi:DNA-binding transcriptional ArsR family regulator